MKHDIKTKLDEKIKELEEKLPNMGGGANCAELTATQEDKVLGLI